MEYEVLAEEGSVVTGEKSEAIWWTGGETKSGDVAGGKETWRQTTTVLVILLK